MRVGVARRKLKPTMHSSGPLRSGTWSYANSFLRTATHNGRTPPPDLTRRVEITENEEGARRVVFLDAPADRDTALKRQRHSFKPQTVATRSDRSGGDAIFSDRNVSSDVVVGPFRESGTMPR